MDRSRSWYVASQPFCTLVIGTLMLISASGCPALLATGVYLFQGGNVVPAEYDGLKHKRVVVICRPPSSHEFRHAGASRAIAHRISELLVSNVSGIDVVNPREVDNWVDEKDWGDFRELAEAVRAEMVVHVELDDFDLFKGKTLYQGHAIVKVSVYDMRDHSRQTWQHDLGEVLYPVNSGIPAQDKPVQLFEREFVEVVADRVALSFYKHDPTANFAMDAQANR